MKPHDSEELYLKKKIKADLNLDWVNWHNEHLSCEFILVSHPVFSINSVYYI